MRSFNDPGAEHSRGGCSVFIATGDATAGHRPLAAHNTWTSVLPFCTFNVMFFVHPDKGYDLTYQSAGGQIWSGVDWYENSAGLLLTETSLPDSASPTLAVRPSSCDCARRSNSRIRSPRPCTRC